MTSTNRKRRGKILLAKAGLDGHERGVKVIARVLRDQGYEVIYSGIRQPPEAIAQIAMQEDVDVVGLSILSGAHLTLAAAVLEALDEVGAGDIQVVLGGTIPQSDIPTLREMGVAEVFGVRADLDEVADWFNSI